MKKQFIKMALISTLVAASTITSLATPVSALTDDYSTKRLGGADRYETAIEISKEFVSDGKVCDTVLLCSDNAWADSISAGQLGVYKNAPILLTGKDKLNAKTLNRMKEIGIKNVFIIGGTGVISDNVKNELVKLGYKVTRYGGTDRYATNKAIVKSIPKEDWGRRPMLINGTDIKQGLSVCVNLRDYDFISGNNSKVYVNPVIMVNSKNPDLSDIESIARDLNTVGDKWNINSGKEIFKVNVDKTLIDNNKVIANKLGSNISSIANTIQTGAKDNATNLSINQGFADVINDTYNPNKRMGALLTTGAYYMDSLSVAPLAGKFNMPLVFIDQKIKDIYGYDISTKADDKAKLFDNVYGNVDKIYYVGGKAVSPDGMEIFLEGRDSTTNPSQVIVVDGIKTFYGHKYGCKTQAEYDAVMKIVNNALGGFDSRPVDSAEYIDMYLNGDRAENYPVGSAEQRGLLRVHKSAGYFLTKVGRTEGIKLLKAREVISNLTTVKTDPLTGEPSSAYDTLVRKTGDCDSDAQVAVAVLDCLGYNAKVLGNDSHGWAVANIGGIWWEVYGSALRPGNLSWGYELD